jgi:hypothetical protein
MEHFRTHRKAQYSLKKLNIQTFFQSLETLSTHPTPLSLEVSVLISEKKATRTKNIDKYHL